MICAQGIWGGAAGVRRNAAGGLRHDLDAALYAMSKKPIAVKIAERLASNCLLDAFDRIENGE